MELRRVRVEPGGKRRRLELRSPRDYDCASDYSGGGDCGGQVREYNAVPVAPELNFGDAQPKFGMSSICGRRRDMEDAVALRPSFFRRDDDTAAAALHYYGVYDGHGCSHVRMLVKSNHHVSKYGGA